MNETEVRRQPSDRAVGSRFDSVFPLGTRMLTPFSTFGCTTVRRVQEGVDSYAVANVVIASPRQYTHASARQYTYASPGQQVWS